MTEFSGCDKVVVYILKSLKYLVWSPTEKVCLTSVHTTDHVRSNNWEIAKSAIFSLSCYCFTKLGGDEGF